jgi:hypothetical protein
MLQRFVRYRPPGKGEDPAANRMRERIGGILIATLGAGITIACWTDHFPPQAGFEFPTIAVLGLALLVIPGYRTERRMRGEDVEALSGRALITPRWWAVLVIAIVIGAINGIALAVAGKI